MTDDLERRLRELSPAQRELFLRLSEQQPPGATPSPASYPLSPAQERFWFLEQIAPGEPAHHLTGVLCLTGELDVPALQDALDRLVARHEALRTCFRAADGVPTAHVQASAHAPLHSEDLRALDDAQRTARRSELLARCAAIELARCPLLRCSLLRLAHDEWQLLWGVHHIVADGLSMLVLANELIALYGALVGEPASPLPPAPLQYHDFAAWQAARERRGAFAPGLAWYAEQLREPPTTRLPADHEAAGGTARGGRCRQALADEVTTALLAVGRSEGCTAYQTMLAGFVAALMRWTASGDLVLGTPVANRTHASLQAAFGLFVNSAVLRFRPDGDASFRALLQHVRAVATATFAHGDVPFERLVQ
ncbi:MAG TPA: condensation domain-containing protein, partial [Planctomycetota bacterium]|nr:condensation domain-containing protein [Planctomycetota bacterium]